MPKKLTYQEVKEYIESFEYILLSEDYIDNKTKLKMICPEGHEWECNFRNFKTGRRCRTCAYKNRANKFKNDYEDVKKVIEDKGYILLSIEYTNNREKLDIICDKGHKFKMCFGQLQQGHGCPKCHGVYRYTSEDVKSKVESEGYELLSEYKGANEYIKIKCPNNHIWECTWASFNCNGHRCPTCKESKGEKRVSEVLNKYNIEYVSQYKFDGCKGKTRILPFDFYISSLNIAIEYDGTPHYVYGTFNSDLLQLMNRKYVDSIKTEYCKKNNIKLIRIPYWEFNNIEKILKHELKKSR